MLYQNLGFKNWNGQGVKKKDINFQFLGWTEISPVDKLD